MVQLFRDTEKGVVKKYFEVMDIKSAKKRGWHVEVKKEPVIVKPKEEVVYQSYKSTKKSEGSEIKKW